MRVPELEPTIVFDEDIEDEQRKLVEAMNELIPSSPASFDFLYGFDTADELVRKTTRLAEGDVPAHQVSLLRAIAGVFESRADANFGYDAATESAAHADSERYESGVRRMRRLRVYVGRRALWLDSKPLNEITGEDREAA